MGAVAVEVGVGGVGGWEGRKGVGRVIIVVYWGVSLAGGQGGGEVI